ncbi:Putative mutator sub-class protein [Arachis hypogaea]|nr:Putative mutator sub-class protein [Arachis hypogaea]
MDVPPFMRSLDLEAIHAPEFFKYTNIGVADPEVGEFRIEMEYDSRKSVIAAIWSYTISRGVNYVVYESKPQTFYAK